MPNRIKEETDDIIISHESPLKILIVLSIGLVLIYLFIDYSGKPEGFYFLFFGIIIILWAILPNETVTIDKKSQRVIIKNNFLKFINKIPFSDINGIYIEHRRYSQLDDVPDSLNLKLTTIQGKTIIIYTAGDNDTANDFARDVARKIENFIPISPTSTWYP